MPLIFAKKSGDDLYKTINSTKLKFLTAEWFFVKAYKYYLDKYCDKAVLQKRADDLIKKYQFHTIENRPSVEMVEHFLNLKGKDTLDLLLNSFFMVDIYPENTDKISVTYEKISL